MSLKFKLNVLYHCANSKCIPVGISLNAKGYHLFEDIYRYGTRTVFVPVRHINRFEKQ